MKLFWFACFSLAALAVFAQAPSSLDGTVAAVLMDRLQLKLTDGSSRQVVLPSGVSVTKRLSVAWTDIHAGDWVGVDSKPGADGSQESVAINVFAPSMIARVRKGQFTMTSGDLMTNAPVEQISPQTGGAALTLKNADAMVGIKITAATVVHRLIDATTSDLKAGVKVTVRGTANDDGSVQAAAVTVTGP